MTKNIDLINKVFLGISLTSWILFFTFIWDVKSYWLGALWFLLSIGLTFPYVATTKKTIKVMTEDEPEQFIEYIDEPVDWQECYKVSKDSELDKEVDKIIEELRGHQDVG